MTLDEFFISRYYKNSDHQKRNLEVFHQVEKLIPRDSILLFFHLREDFTEFLFANILTPEATAQELLEELTKVARGHGKTHARLLLFHIYSHPKMKWLRRIDRVIEETAKRLVLKGLVEKWGEWFEELEAASNTLTEDSEKIKFFSDRGFEFKYWIGSEDEKKKYLEDDLTSRLTMKEFFPFKSKHLGNLLPKSSFPQLQPMSNSIKRTATAPNKKGYKQETTKSVTPEEIPEQKAEVSQKRVTALPAKAEEDQEVKKQVGDERYPQMKNDELVLLGYIIAKSSHGHVDQGDLTTFLQKVTGRSKDRLFKMIGPKKKKFMLMLAGTEPGDIEESQKLQARLNTVLVEFNRIKLHKAVELAERLLEEAESAESTTQKKDEEDTFNEDLEGYE